MADDDDGDEFAVRLRWPAGGPIADARHDSTGPADDNDDDPADDNPEGSEGVGAIAVDSPAPDDTPPEPTAPSAPGGDPSDHDAAAADDDDTDVDHSDVDHSDDAGTEDAPTDVEGADVDRIDDDGGTAAAAAVGVGHDVQDRPTEDAPGVGGWVVDDADAEWVDAHVVDDDVLDALPAVPLLPAMAGRLESLHGALTTLAMRVDAVTSAMASYRSALGDRIDDHTETLARLQRSASADQDEQRRGTDRLVAELRRSVGDHEAALRRVAGRVEDVATDLTGVADQVRRAEAERARVPTGPSLDEVGAAAADQAVVALRPALGALRTELAEVRETVAVLGPVVGAVAALGHDLGLVREDLGRVAARRDVDELRAAVDAVRLEGARNVAVAEVVEGVEALRIELEAIRAEAAKTAGRRELAEVRDALDAVVEGDPRIERVLSEVASLRLAIAARPGIDELRAAVDAVAVRVDALPDATRLDDLRTSLAADDDGGGAEDVLALVRPELEALAGRIDAGLGATRDELHLLKRRLGVRATAPVALDADQMAAIADVVVTRLSGAAGAGGGGQDTAALADAVAQRVIDAVAERVVEQIAQRFEVVDDAGGAEPDVPASGAPKAGRRRR